MELVSSVHTIMGMAQDILAALQKASGNKSRCNKVAKRVRCLKDILQKLDGGTSAAMLDGGTTAVMLDRLAEALRGALQVVRRCQRFGFLRSIVVVFAGGRIADPLDVVEADIDRCILDLTFASSLRIARLEKLLLPQHNNPEKQKGEMQVMPIGSSGADMDMDDHERNTAATTAAVGVPVCTAVTAAAVHEHEMTTCPACYDGYYGYSRSSYGYYYYWRNDHGCACDSSWDEDGPPSDAAFYHRTQYASCPSMFSDDNPNSCSIL